MDMVYRYNIMDITSITEFAKIRGGCNGKCRDVYFLRLLGGVPSLQKEVADAERILFEAMGNGKLFYRRVTELPSYIEREEQDYYLRCHENWISCGKVKLVTRFTERNMEFQALFGKAAETVCEKYAACKKGISDSIKKNLVVKIAWWVDRIFGQMKEKWDSRSCIKIIAENIAKEQEYLFFYFLTLIGADVLFLQTKADIALPERLAGLSKAVKTGEFGAWDLPEPTARPAARQPGEAEENRRNTVKIPPRENRRNTAKVPPRESVRNTVKIPPRESGQNTVKIPSRESVRNTVKIPPRENRPVACSMSGSAVSDTGNTSSVVSGIHNGTERREKSFEELARLASSVVMVAIHGKDGKVIGSGSGIMIGKDGYVLTNNHVIRDGRYFSVRIEEEEKAYPTDEIIKYNPVLDLAVIRIDRKLLPLPVFDGRNPLVRGQKVVAIGSPLGLFNSVSDGIISGFRTIDRVEMIQFTAPISHGSSGGAVLNMYGEVIGISTAGFDDAQNINLAVSYDQILMFTRGFR